MEENDRRINEGGGQLNLLIDSSAYHELNKIADAVGEHPLILLESYPKIRNFFSQAMVNENIRGNLGFNGETQWMFGHSLQDEGAFIGKESTFLYNHEDGSIKTITMNNISGVDYGQILLTQNHKNLVLMTNDHRMLKSAGALIGGRIMDVPSFLGLMRNTHEEGLQVKWQEMYDWYDTNGGYVPPKTVNYIEGIVPEVHPLTGKSNRPDPKSVIPTRKKRKK